MSFLSDIRFALRSLARARGLVITVGLTLALGIGANAAIFTVVQGVLLRPLANRDEQRLVYIRQSAPGAHVENAAFSIPELRDLQSGNNDRLAAVHIRGEARVGGDGRGGRNVSALARVLSEHAPNEIGQVEIVRKRHALPLSDRHQRR